MERNQTCGGNGLATEMTSSLEQFKGVMLRTMNKHGTTTQPNNA